MIEQQLERIADALQRMAAVQEAMLDAKVEKLDAGHPAQTETVAAPAAEPAPVKATRKTKAKAAPVADDLTTPTGSGPAEDDPKAVKAAQDELFTEVNAIVSKLNASMTPEKVGKLTAFLRDQVFPGLGIQKTRDAKTLDAVALIKRRLGEWKALNMGIAPAAAAAEEDDIV